ncbi:MAG: hypothetical protein OEY14_12375 [Myxococcales bacterium]|nr:hypothetical protein [Myxococcales bacterium]
MGSGSSLFSLLLGEVGAGPASPEALLEEAGVEGSEGLLSLLLEPVPAGSGAQEIGEGPYAYLKLNPVDHSMRVFRFPTREGALEAQAIGVLAEQLGGPQPDEPEDPGLAA